MKRFTPYIFPLVVLLVIFFLVYRWYSLRSQQRAEDAEFGEGIQIENLSEEEAANVVTGVGDVETAPLEAPVQPDKDEVGLTTGQNLGTIRYEITEDKVLFSVLANLDVAGLTAQAEDGTTMGVSPEALADKEYTVYVRSIDGDDLTEAFKLVVGKGGLLGSASISTDLLPVEVIVTDAKTKSEVLDNILLRGVIQSPEHSDLGNETEQE